MKEQIIGLTVVGTIAASLSCNAATCNIGARSSDVICGDNCAAFQQTDSLPDQPSQGVVRLAVGGDSRDDRSGVVPWAFTEAKRRGAQGFLFLGDLEITSAMDKRFV